MAPELAYYLKVNIGIALFYAFYRLFFYKDTFFQWRRYAMLSFLVISMLYPLMNIQNWIREQEPISQIATIYAQAVLPEMEIKPDSNNKWAEIVTNIVPYIYYTGVILLFVRFLIQLFSICILALRSRKIEINGITVRIPKKASAPFSFFRWIFISPELHTEKEAKEILIHEETHAQQMHSVDVIISEIITILCWINPFAWLLKREIRNNLEYMADNRVVLSGHDTKSYQYHLLGLANQKAAANLYNNFNVLPIKNRIVMMNKKRTKNIGKTKYLIFMPLAALLMIISNIEAVARVTSKLTKDFEVPLIKNETVPEITSYIPAPITNATDSAKPKKKAVYTVVEVMPHYPGGTKALLKYIAANLRYPVEAQEAKEEGKVYIRFTVTEKGYVEAPTIMRSVSPSLDNEAIRIISSMQKWTPGKQNGKNVSVYYVMPILFKLNGSPANSKGNTSEKNKITVVGYGANSESNSNTSLKTNEVKSKATPLYILDGKEISATEMKKLNPDNIQSINVLKDKSATEIYGDKGVNGVILITLKK